MLRRRPNQSAAGRWFDASVRPHLRFRALLGAAVLFIAGTGAFAGTALARTQVSIPGSAGFSGVQTLRQERRRLFLRNQLPMDQQLHPLHLE